MTPTPAALPELPALPLCYSGAPVSVTWAEDGETSSREVYTAEQMHKYATAYGLTCIESAQAPKAGAVAEPTEAMIRAGAFLEGRRVYSDAEVRNIYMDMEAAKGAPK